MRKAELSGHLSLIETSLFARRDELLKDRIVLSLERSRPRFPRSSSFRRPRLAHGTSFDNGLPNPLIRDRLEQERYAVDRSFECPEVAGKTIQTLRVFQNHGEGDEVLIEFTDGTSFSCCLEIKSMVTASLFRPTAGTPEVIRSYPS